MDTLITILEYAVPFLVVLTALVFFHELGHYLVARWNKVRVDVFSVGFGPELFGRTDKAGTRWKFSVIPLGGYVKMFGENAVTSSSLESTPPLSPEERAVSFQHKTVAQRSAIVFAGPAANFLLAIVIFAGLFAIVGQPFTSPEVGRVESGSAAAEAGLQPGDVFVSIDGRVIDRFEDVKQVVLLNAGDPLDIVVRRGEEHVSIAATPRLAELTDNSGKVHRIPILGVKSKGRAYIRHGPVDAVTHAVQETGRLSVATLQALGQVISGKRDSKDLGGPIMIAKLSHDFAQVSPDSLIWLMALLSINLGLLNLFPVPMLDGGHLLFYGVEAALGRPLGEKAQEVGLRIGLALVICLMVFVTVNDLINL